MRDKLLDVLNCQMMKDKLFVILNSQIKMYKLFIILYRHVTKERGEPSEHFRQG